MSWWSSSEIEKEILKATSSSIPSGEQDLALNLEISDSVRSKQASAPEVIRVLRKRLYEHNPNVQILTLHLLDLLIKNGGQHFFVESASKDFVDAYVAQLMSLLNQNRNPEVVDLMLDYFQTWALASASKPEGTYLREKYEELKKRRDITFPDPGPVSDISSSFLEAATAPEWVDSDTCMRSGQPFTFYNRKHHCRNCGGVFLQEYCTNFRPLPHFGINIPVRICDDCNAKLDAKYGDPRRRQKQGESAGRHTNTGPGASRKISSNNRDIGSKYRDDLEQAISLSLQASKKSQPLEATAGGSANQREGGDDEDIDEEMRLAIEASLREMNQSSQTPQQQHLETQQYQRGQQVPQVQQVQTQEPQPALPPKDREDIEEFYGSVQTANPREAVYNQRLIDLNRSAIGLQPKIISELRKSSGKLATLEDLHAKLLAVSSYYDRLLEAELNPELNLPVENGYQHDEHQQEDQKLEKNPLQSPQRTFNEPSYTPGTNAYQDAYKQGGPKQADQGQEHEQVLDQSKIQQNEPGTELEPQPEPEAEPEQEPEPEPILIEL